MTRQTQASFYETQVEHTKLVVDGLQPPVEAPPAVVPVSEVVGAGAAVPAPNSPPTPHGQTIKVAKLDPSEDDARSQFVDIDTLKSLHASIHNSKTSTVAPKPSPEVAPAVKAPIAVAKTGETPPTTGDVKQSDRPLVTYVYSQTDSAERNLRFFVSRALNDAADFIFIINGEPAQAREIIPKKANIKVVERENDCYDLGSHAEILTTHIAPDGTALKKGDKGGTERWKMYKKFILLNASIRGPFLPNWSSVCWMNAYLGKLSSDVKLVGMTANCWPQFHVQSMIWATDSVGLELLLYPPQPEKIPEGLPEDWKEVGINGCFHTWDEAVHAEVFSTQIIRNGGKNQIAVMMSAFHSDKDYIDHCDSGGNGDVLWNGKYFGTNVHPYETIFMKTNRDIDPVLIEKLTKWKEGEKYSSYDHCRA